MRSGASAEEHWRVLQRETLRRLLDTLRAAFSAVAQAEASIPRRGHDARERFMALMNAGQRLSARIAQVEAQVEPVELYARSALGQAQDMAPAVGDLPTRVQCQAATDPERRLRRRGITFGRHCGVDKRRRVE